MLAGAIDNLLEPIYYVAGPPPMVKAMRELLVLMRVPEKQIRTDEFFGY
jgi:ferredoxin-NADP reductase